MTKSDDQLVAVVSYLTWVGWIIALIFYLNKKTKLAGFHLRQTLLLHIAGSIIMFLHMVGWILAVFLVIFWFIGIISAFQGKETKIPLLGEAAQKWFKNF